MLVVVRYKKLTIAEKFPGKIQHCNPAIAKKDSMLKLLVFSYKKSVFHYSLFKIHATTFMMSLISEHKTELFLS